MERRPWLRAPSLANYFFVFCSDDIAWNYFLHMKGAPPPLTISGIEMSEVFTHESKRTGEERLCCNYVWSSCAVLLWVSVFFGLVGTVYGKKWVRVIDI